MRPWRFFWLFAGLLWLVLLAYGWHGLLRHDLAPGLKGQVPERWPIESALPHDSEVPMLLLFAHRNCPCTRTSLQELEYILTNSAGRARVVIVLVTPAEARTDRVGGDIEARARLLAGAEVAIDVNGAEARRFHIRTSGHVVLYGADRHLLFSGGITAGRGHRGDSSGRRAVLARLQREETGPTSAPVFGCSLFADEDEGDQEYP